jgi:hypothetical protein
MRKLLFILSLLISTDAFAQTIWFQMQRVNYCTKETKIDSSYYYLTDMLGVSYKNIRGKVYLPAFGEYQVHYPRQPELVFPLIRVINNETVYTHYDSKIRIDLGVQYGSLYVYKDCKGLLNGVQEDFYQDGTVKMRGNFKNGVPKDSITLFYENGGPHKSIIYLPRHLYIKEFDSLSNLVKISHYGTDPTALPSFVTTTFYPGGSIQTNERLSRGFVYLTEYYQGKKIKVEMDRKSRKEYTPRGMMEAMYKWKERASNKDPYYNKKFEVVKSSYDASGRKTEEIKYHISSDQKQPPVGLGMAAYFVYWKKFSPDGQERLLFKNKTREQVLEQGLFF